jgi:large subunit ribosomal protein L27e
MSKARQAKRSKVKPFIKVINYNHLMPTRYTLELEGLKGAVTGETFSEVSQREDAKKVVKKTLEERYQSGKNKWFFTPLRKLLEMRICRFVWSGWLTYGTGF